MNAPRRTARTNFLTGLPDPRSQSRARSAILLGAAAIPSVFMLAGAPAAASAPASAGAVDFSPSAAAPTGASHCSDWNVGWYPENGGSRLCGPRSVVAGKPSEWSIRTKLSGKMDINVSNVRDSDGSHVQIKSAAIRMGKRNVPATCTTGEYAYCKIKVTIANHKGVLSLPLRLVLVTADGESKTAGQVSVQMVPDGSPRAASQNELNVLTSMP